MLKTLKNEASLKILAICFTGLSDQGSNLGHYWTVHINKKIIRLILTAHTHLIYYRVDHKVFLCPREIFVGPTCALTGMRGGRSAVIS